MASFNQTMLLGNLGKDPEFRFTPNGMAVAKCSLAVNEYSKDKAGNKQTKTLWVNLTFWKELAEIAEKYLEKGSQILVTGKLCCDQYTNKEGHNTYSWYVNVTSMQMLGEKPERQTAKSAVSSKDEFNPFLDEEE